MVSGGIKSGRAFINREVTARVSKVAAAVAKETNRSFRFLFFMGSRIAIHMPSIFIWVTCKVGARAE